MADTTETLLAVAIDNIRDLQREVERNRDAIHKLQSSLRGVDLLTREVKALQDNLPHLARQAARDAVTEYVRRQRSDNLKSWSTYAAIAATGIALGALIVSLIHYH